MYKVSMTHLVQKRTMKYVQQRREDPKKRGDRGRRVEEPAVLRGRPEAAEDAASSSEDEDEAERRRARARARRMQHEMHEAPLEDDEPDEDDQVCVYEQIFFHI
ncbi:hypothetical protein Tcan_02098 [Toxocara canis]|uniref:Uncharacterized protein n=1 Tax=Toxocara canis TaxID=6265 RepID=A0A0B2URD7_TOXCA|nr:hypothetical protein Tcan_02098 [Toxocara canis]